MLLYTTWNQFNLYTGGGISIRHLTRSPFKAVYFQKLCKNYSYKTIETTIMKEEPKTKRILIYVVNVLSRWIGGNRKRLNDRRTGIENGEKQRLRQLGDKWQSKPMFLNIFDLRSSIVITFLIATYPVCFCCLFF